jgi:hypothetical protein
MEVCQNKMRLLRKYLRGWAKNLSGSEKEHLLSIIDNLDCKAENFPLDEEERMLLPPRTLLQSYGGTRSLNELNKPRLKTSRKGGEYEIFSSYC